MTETIYNREQKLQNALIATPYQSLHVPSIQDIYLAVERKCGLPGKPTGILHFPPDFILYLTNTQEQEAVLSHNHRRRELQTHPLLRWTNEYRLNVEEWNTHVSTLWNQDSWFWQQQWYMQSKCLHKNHQFYPKNLHLGISYNHCYGVKTHTFPITLITPPYTEPEQNPSSEWAQDPSPDIDFNDSSSNFDPGKQQPTANTIPFYISLSKLKKHRTIILTYRLSMTAL